MQPSISNILLECDTSEMEGDYPGGLQRARRAFDQLTLEQDAIEKMILLERLARFLTHLGKYAEAQELAEKIIVRNPDSHLAVDALVTLGVCASKKET